MNLGTLLSSAGQVSSGMREAEENERIARQNQLRVEELNRLEGYRRDIRKEVGVPQEVAAITEGRDLGIGVRAGLAPTAPAGVREPTVLPGRPAAAAPKPAVPKPAAGQRSITPTVPRIKSTWSADDTRELQKIDTIIRDLAPLNYNPYDYILYSQPRFQNMLNSYFPNYAREIMDKPIQERGKAIQNLFANLEKRRDELLAKKQQWNTEQDAALSVIQRQTEKQDTERYYRSLGLTPPASAAPASAQGATTAAGTTVPAEVPSGRGRRAIEAWIRGDGTSPAAAAAPTASATAAGLTQYDAPTQYDGLIQQAAVANGLDPVVFKRLIGSESSFNPNAKSRRGDEYGLGIAQIAAVHGLSREEMLDPATALPFAAQLFKQYLDESGGDYRQAILRYKGATSERGIQEMNAVIDRDIFPEQTTTVAAAEPAAAPAASARAARGADALGSLAAPGAIDYSRRVALQQRQELVNLARLQRNNGLSNEFLQTRQLIMQLDSQLAYLQGMQGLSNLQLAKDPRLLAGVLSFYTGNDVAIQRFNDGTYDMFFNGEKIEENLDAATLADIARLQFDPEYRQRQAEATAKYNEERYKTAMELQNELLKIRANMGRELAVQSLKNQGEMLVARVNRDNPELKVINLSDGNIAITHPDGGVYTFNIAGQVEKIDGVEVTTRTAQRVGGLPRLAARN